VTTFLVNYPPHTLIGWPGERLSELYCDPRSLDEGQEKRSSMHAKCSAAVKSISTCRVLVRRAKPPRGCTGTGEIVERGRAGDHPLGLRAELHAHEPINVGIRPLDSGRQFCAGVDKFLVHQSFA